MGIIVRLKVQHAARGKWSDSFPVCFSVRAPTSTTYTKYVNAKLGEMIKLELSHGVLRSKKKKERGKKKKEKKKRIFLTQVKYLYLTGCLQLEKSSTLVLYLAQYV